MKDTVAYVLMTLVLDAGNFTKVIYTKEIEENEVKNCQIEAGGSMWRLSWAVEERENSLKGGAVHDLQPDVDQGVCIYYHWCHV